jgi:N-acetyl-1-D-myo-inositol-2-amino-2-deoxy-alpha-D-glucopyranoside deacetylase
VHEFVVTAVDRIDSGGLPPWVYFATWPADLATELVREMEKRELPADLWGLVPQEFGVPAGSITTKVDARRFLPAKLAALRSHRTQLPDDHLFSNLPGDLAERFLGWEYFIRSRPRNAHGDRLLDLVSGTMKVPADV